jgi:hypothetical protein
MSSASLFGSKHFFQWQAEAGPEAGPQTEVAWKKARARVAWKKARAREAWKKAKARKAWKKEKAREAWNKACIRNGSKRRLMLGLIEGCKRVEEGVPGGPGKRGGGLTQQSKTDEICLKVARGLKKAT